MATQAERDKLAAALKPKKRSKYRAERTKVDGVTHASKKQAKRWQELRILQRGNQIRNLRREVAIPITINGIHVCDYVADHIYEQASVHTDVHWHPVVEDVKSPITRKNPVYVLKKKLMRAVNGIVIKEV